MAVKPVAEWTLEDAKKFAAADLPVDVEINRKMIEDKDHWQDGSLWPGYRTGDAAVDATIRNNVKPQFISDDVLGEIVDNRSGAMVGQEASLELVALVAQAEVEAAAETPDVTAAPAPEAGAPVAGVEEEAQTEDEVVIAALSAWWDRVGLWPLMRQVLDRISYAGRASIRCYVPGGKLINDSLPTVPDLASALANIELDAPVPNMAARYVDPLTSAVSSIVITKVEEKEQAEVWTVDPLTKQTNVRILGETPRVMGPFDMKGRLPLAVAKGQRIVTPSLRSVQSQLNFIATVTTRTVETGHRERYLGNVDPPGMWLPAPPSNGPALDVDESNPLQTYWKHRVPWIVGANITTELVGLPEVTRDSDGKEKVSYMTPSITSLDPVDPSFATNAAAVVRRSMYRLGKQGHLGLDSTSEASGVAYQQARAQFEGDLNALKPPIEMMLRDLIEAVLAYCGLMTGSASTLLDRYRVAITLHPNPGPVGADEARLAVELRDKRAISQETMLGRLGIEDPQAEQETIDSTPAQAAVLWTALITALSGLMALPDMTLAGAGYLLGLSEEQLTVLATGLPPAGEGVAVPEAAKVTARAEGANAEDDAADAAGNGAGRFRIGRSV